MNGSLKIDQYFCEVETTYSQTYTFNVDVKNVITFIISEESITDWQSEITNFLQTNAANTADTSLGESIDIDTINALLSTMQKAILRNPTGSIYHKIKLGACS